VGKKRSPDQKDANLKVSVEFEPGDVPASASILKNGDFVFLDREGRSITPKKMVREMSHDRAKGAKVRTRTSLQDSAGVVGGLSHLASYDVIFAIDTNSVDLGDEFIAVSGFLPFSVRRREGDYFFELGEKSIQIYEFHGLTYKPELFAISKLISDLEKSSAKKMPRIGIVTDSELGSLDAFNTRTAPLIGEVYLPNHFTLMYASTDTGWEVTNKVLRLCDSAATSHINDIKAKVLPEAPLVTLEGFPSISIRVGRRNAQILIDQANLMELALREGQRVTMWGIK
jgi:hypothetical protein